MITYGEGKVLYDGSAKAFHIRYKGSIRITSSPDNLFIKADRNTIKGIMIDDSNLPQELFTYVGELRSLWGTRNGTYLIGSKQRYNAHSIVVNNNLKTQYDAQFYYPDGSPVPANELIHIHSDGVVMSGGVHTEDSVILKDTKTQTITQITQQPAQPTATTTYSSSGSSGGSTGGGGY